MSKYDPLWNYLSKIKAEAYPLKLSFEQIRMILGFEMDHSFLNNKKEAPRYGIQVGKISLKEKTVTFLQNGEQP